MSHNSGWQLANANLVANVLSCQGAMSLHEQQIAIASEASFSTSIIYIFQSYGKYDKVI
jgi:hypothetical protein